MAKSAPSKNGSATSQRMNKLSSTVRELITNTITTRAQLFKFLSDELHNINKECGYPDIVTATDCKTYFEREGIANRVVTLFPQETWVVEPEIYDSEDESTETEFEFAWQKLNRQFGFFDKLLRVDEISGIGHYGILLLGIDDGKELSEPVDGIDPITGMWSTGQDYTLLYLMPYDETQAQVASLITDRSSPRFGKPEYYNVNLFDPGSSFSTGTVVPLSHSAKVHWSRVIHVADNCSSNDVWGMPRMEKVYNRLVDIRKLLGGSAEMFWKGAFPGYSFEVPPQLAADIGDLDLEGMKDQIDKYYDGLQRYFALSGLSAKSLATQIADPSTHLEVQITAVCIALGVPKRIFMGSEQAQLASAQDSTNWTKRIIKRQNSYVTTRIILPFTERLIAYGVLPSAEDENAVQVHWPEMYTLTAAEKATAAATLTTAIATYVQSGAATLIPPLEFLVTILDMDLRQAEKILLAAEAEISKAEFQQIPGMPPPPEEFPDTENPEQPFTPGGGEPGQFPESKKPPVANVFCPTGPGGGIDPTCTKDGTGSGSAELSDSDKAAQIAAHQKDISNIETQLQALKSTTGGKPKPESREYQQALKLQQAREVSRMEIAKLENYRSISHKEYEQAKPELEAILDRMRESNTVTVPGFTGEFSSLPVEAQTAAFQEFEKQDHSGLQDEAYDLVEQDTKIQLQDKYGSDYDDNLLATAMENKHGAIAAKQDDLVSDKWQSLSGEEKAAFVDLNKYDLSQSIQGTSIAEPDTWEVLDNYSDGYKETQAVVRYLQHERTADLLVQRGLYDNREAASQAANEIAQKTWSAWKNDSGSAYGNALQLAAAEELGSLGKPEIMANDLITNRESVIQKVGEENYAAIKAHARATWESSQYALEQAGIDKVPTWRGIIVDKSLVDDTTQISFSYKAVSGDIEHVKLPNMNVLRNSAQSTTTLSSVANNWRGAGGVSLGDGGKTRMVLRIEADRTSVLSLPVHGQNVEKEQEVVVTGSNWHSWDAWWFKAPDIAIGSEFDKLLTQKES